MGFRTKLIQKLVHWNEAVFFYPKLRRFYRENLKGDSVNIIDVGANKGQSIEFFLRLYPLASIHSFEPNPKLFRRLVEEHQNNSRILLHNLGISNSDGELEFYENVLDETSTFETLNPDSKYLKKKARILGVKPEDIIVASYKVKVISLSKFLQRHAGVTFDLLKIDVEGHELECLKGLFGNGGEVIPIRYIQLESHEDDMYANGSRQGEIKSLLKENGYQPKSKIKHGFGDFYEIVYEKNATA